MKTRSHLLLLFAIGTLVVSSCTHYSTNKEIEKRHDIFLEKKHLPIDLYDEMKLFSENFSSGYVETRAINELEFSDLKEKMKSEMTPLLNNH